MKKNNITGNYLTEKVPIKYFLLIMRTTLILLFTCVFCSMAEVSYTQNAKVTINKRYVTLEEVLNEIENQTDYLFIYSNEINTSEKVSLKAKQEAVSKVLDKLFKDKDVKYSMEGNHIILSTIERVNTLEKETIAAVQQQKKTITGTVKDQNGEPIIGANIIEVGTTNGTVTDMDGNFTLSVEDDATIRISYIGYLEQDINTAGKTSFNIILLEDTQALEEVVVIGYGSVKKANLTSSVSKITDEALKDRPITTIGEAFQGQLAGVQAQATSGGIPGEEMTIRIRGVNTVNGDSSPLYVIDGVPRDNMNGINPSDIATIQILKDAAASSIYGSRGANGVVLIETKTGTGKPSVTFDAYYGFQVAEKSLDTMTGPEYVAYNWMMRNYSHILNNGGSISDPMSSRQVDYQVPEWWADFTDFTNWEKLVLRTSPIQNYVASASGQNDMGSLFFSVGYLDQEGIVINTNYNRYNFRLNGSLNISNNIRIGANVSLITSVQKIAGANLGDRQGKDSSFHHALMQSPLVKQGENIRTEDNTGGVVSQNEYGASWIDPVEQLERTVDDTNTTRIQSSVWGEWKPINGLTYKIQFSKNYDGTTYEYFQPASVNLSQYSSSGSSYSERYDNWVLQNTLTYDKIFGENHHLNLLLGQSAEKQKYYIGNMEANGWPYENIATLNVASTALLASTTHTNYTNASFFGRVNYDLKDRYLFSASLRRDGSSRFGPKTKWGNFPSASVGWKINEESFLQDAKWINLMKLRMSMGTSGNDRIGDYAYLSQLGSYNAAYGNTLQLGASGSNIANADLKWEQTRSWNFGFDFSALKNRLQFNIDYYINTTSNLLFDIPVPYSTGYNSQLTNIGELRNKGWEFDVTSHNIDRKNFSWNTSLNLSHNSNEVLDMGSVESFTVTQNGQQFITKVGGPVSQFYVFRTNGVLTSEDFDSNGKALVPIADGQIEGNTKLVDTNGDEKITSADMVPYGNNLPDLIWGLTNRFSYKNWELSLLLQGQFGGEILNLGARHNDDGGAFNRTLMSRWLRSYKNDGLQEALSDPDLQAYILKHNLDVSWDGKTPVGLPWNEGNSDWRIYDATYVRIKNITLSYTLPGSALKKTRISGLKIYASIDNVYTFSDYPGYTPETSSYGNSNTMMGVDYSTYPLSRKFTFGFTLNL
jgi:TonB-linked SusC/RagA family outer membrane protein